MSEYREPRVGDMVIDGNSVCGIVEFCEDRGTFLSAQRWVSIADFEWNTEGYWERRKAATPVANPNRTRVNAEHDRREKYVSAIWAALPPLVECRDDVEDAADAVIAMADGERRAMRAAKKFSRFEREAQQ